MVRLALVTAHSLCKAENKRFPARGSAIRAAFLLQRLLRVFERLTQLPLKDNQGPSYKAERHFFQSILQRQQLTLIQLLKSRPGIQEEPQATAKRSRTQSKLEHQGTGPSVQSRNCQTPLRTLKQCFSSPSQTSSNLHCWVMHQHRDEILMPGQELVCNSSFKISFFDGNRESSQNYVIY